MPDSPILKLVFSVIFLQNQRVPRNEAFAAGAAAALIPGALGLAVPLIVAGRERASVAPISDRRTLAEVPNVIGKNKDVAKAEIKDKKLNPVSRSVFIQGGKVEDEGEVVDQKPKSGEFMPLGTDVTLTISLGPPLTEPSDDLAIHRQIQEGVEDAQQQIETAKQEILKEIREHAKDTPKYGGALEKKQSP